MSKFSSRIDFEKICRFCGIVFCWCGSGDVNKTYSKRLFPSCPQPLFKARLIAKTLLWFFFSFTLMQIKFIFTRRVLHLASFWKWEVLGFGNNLVPRAFPLLLVVGEDPGNDLARKWPIKFNVRNVFSLVIFRTRTAAKVLGIERKGWKTGARVRLFVWLFSFISLNPTFQGRGKWWRGFNLAQLNLMRASAQAIVRWVRVELYRMFCLVRI